MAPGMRSRRTSSFTWNGESGSPWPTDVESSNETSADDFSDHDEPGRKFGEDRRTLKIVSYDSDSCLTPRSRRTLRRTVSSSTDPPCKAPALETIFSPTHEILHPLQSLRLERSLSSKSTEFIRTKVYRTSVTFETFTLPKPPQLAMEPQNLKPFKPSPGNFDSYAFPRNSVEYDNYDNFPSTPTVEEEKLEQKQSLITVNEEREIVAPNVVVIIVDAEKKPTFVALDWAIHVAVRPGDEIIILGVLKHIFSPTGYKMVANTDPLHGVNREFLQLEVNKTAESFESKVSESGRREECEKKKVKLSVRIAPGARARVVVVRELRVLGATYAIFDRKAMRSRRYYGKHLSCHAVRMRRNGRSTKTITQLVPTSTKTSRSPTSSEISSVSSMSTDRASSESLLRSPTFWRRITTFRSICRSRIASPRSSPSSTHRSDILTSPVSEDFPDVDHLSSKLKSLHLTTQAPADAYSYEAMDSHRRQLAAVSVTIPPAICAS